MLALGLEKCLCTFVLGDCVLPWIRGTDPALEKKAVYTLGPKWEVNHEVCSVGALKLRHTGKTFPAKCF